MNNIFKLYKIVFILGFLGYVSFFSTSISALSSEWGNSEKSKVRIISSKTHSDNMNEIIIGFEYNLDPGWKTYWKSPGGGGFPQNIIWNNSKNINDLTIEWPTPKEFEILGLSSIGYEEKVIFPIVLDLIDQNETTIIDVNLNYLVCKEICIPGNANLNLEIPPGKGEYTSFFYDIEKVRSSSPTNIINKTKLSEFDVGAIQNEEKIIFNLDVETQSFFKQPNIFIHTPFGLPVVKPTINYSLDYKKMNIRYKFDKKQFSKENFPVEIIFHDEEHNFIYNEIIKIEKKDIFFNYNDSLISILAIAIIGGFILNLMPCVFPVLSIKLLSVLNTDYKNIRLSFIITSLGIISSFIILAFLFVILKQLNISISWGMQFQQPLFLLSILVIIVFFLLNTLGLFEIRLPATLQSSNIFLVGKNFYTKNFFNGFFATLLATPCSAPFIGTAVTAAFTQSASYTILIFLFMGIGMSLPYLIVIFFPKMVLKLPKPGIWTNYVKYFLAFLLFLTILWILNILMVYYNFWFLLLFTFITTTIIVAIIFNFYSIIISSSAVFIFFIFSSLNLIQKGNSSIADEDWINFDNINFEEMLTSEKVVFLDITADWCVTCQFNKINVIGSNEIMTLFLQNDVKLVKADWTMPNKKISDFLKKNNKYGIPFNAFYSKKYPDGIILSELLTKKNIKDAFENIK